MIGDDFISLNLTKCAHGSIAVYEYAISSPNVGSTIMVASVQSAEGDPTITLVKNGGVTV